MDRVGSSHLESSLEVAQVVDRVVHKAGCLRCRSRGCPLRQAGNREVVLERALKGLKEPSCSCFEQGTVVADVLPGYPRWVG